MFEKVPDAFGRDFLASFFAPMVVFVGVQVLLLYTIGLVPSEFSALDLTSKLLLLGVIAWIGGLLLNAVNGEIYRFLEGYGTLNPLRLFKPVELLLYRRHLRQISAIDAEYRDSARSGTSLPQDRARLRRRLYGQRVKRFPIREELVLPTPFGNRMRAFESYVDEMYGAESITLWSHLTAVIDKEFMENLIAAKSMADFWINSSMLSLVLLIEVLLLYTMIPTVTLIVSAMIVLAFMLFAYYRAQNGAVQWGRYFRAAFDLYLPRLWVKLGYPTPANRTEATKYWRLYSQAVTYRQTHLLTQLDDLIRQSSADSHLTDTPGTACDDSEMSTEKDEYSVEQEMVRSR